VSGLAFVALTYVLGLGALFPLRRSLTPFGYAVGALPAGILCWALATAAVNVVRSEPSAPLALAAAAAAALLIAAAGRWLTLHVDSPDAFDWRPVGVWSAAVLAVSAVAAATGMTALSWDSSFSYASWGVWLADTGAYESIMLSSRNVLIPSMIAVERLLGGSWQSAIYPVLAVNTLAILALAISSTKDTSHRGRIAGTLAGVSLLAYATPFAFHTLYVHSHMLSATFLLLALLATERARERGADAWLLLAGLATAGLVLARPDGIAYAVVPATAAVFAALSRDDGHAALISFTSGFLVPTWLVTGSALATLGLWEGEKLTGAVMLSLLVAYTVALAVVTALAATRRHVRWARGILWTLVGAVIAAVTAVWVMAPDRATEAGTNIYANLVAHSGVFGAGGYAVFWAFAAGLVLLTLVASRLRRDGDLLRLVTWIAFFAAVSFVVHAVTHQGRVGWNDSHTRVVFHIVPVIMWLYGAALARVIPEPRGGAPSSAEEDVSGDEAERSA
jgi:hypothetical protein